MGVGQLRKIWKTTTLDPEIMLYALSKEENIG